GLAEQTAVLGALDETQARELAHMPTVEWGMELEVELGRVLTHGSRARLTGIAALVPKYPKERASRLGEDLVQLISYARKELQYGAPRTRIWLVCISATCLWRRSSGRSSGSDCRDCRGTASGRLGRASSSCSKRRSSA